MSKGIAESLESVNSLPDFYDLLESLDWTYHMTSGATYSRKLAVMNRVTDKAKALGSEYKQLMSSYALWALGYMSENRTEKPPRPVEG